MTSFTARYEWIKQEGLRLDATAYASGALATRDHILNGPWSVHRLGSLARLFYGPRASRRYVTNTDAGVPFLSTSDMFLADLASVPLVSKTGTAGLQELLLEEGWSLISRSGTVSVGNTAYTRSEMHGMAASEHIIRVVPDKDIIKPGYLFAFLSSPSGQVLIRARIFGTLIQHIEPNDIARIPVPLPSADLQDRIHRLVQGAADARSEASRLLDEASVCFDARAGAMTSSHEHAYAVGSARRSGLNSRLDAFHHVGWAVEGLRMSGQSLRDIAKVTRPAMVKRIYAARGVPFVSGMDVYRVRPSSRERIMRREAERTDCLIQEGTILVQRGGQRYGLLGQPAFAGRRMVGWAASEDLMHVRLFDEAQVGRVFAYLRSQAGRRALLRWSYGTSIPKLNVGFLAAVEIPELDPELAKSARQALDLREKADAEEEQAIWEVEAWLS